MMDFLRRPSDSGLPSWKLELRAHVLEYWQHLQLDISRVRSPSQGQEHRGFEVPVRYEKDKTKINENVTESRKEVIGDQIFLRRTCSSFNVVFVHLPGVSSSL
jgi:hypothetical protein